MTNIFISYSREDKHEARVIVNLLEVYNSRGVVFYDERLEAGTQWREAIFNQIEGADIFIYMLSENSIESPYCQEEYAFASLLAKRILPIKIKKLESTPEQLRHLNILDLFPVSFESIARMLSAIARYEYEARHLPDTRGQSTLFDVRRSHFAPEKELLSEKIVNIVDEELKQNKDQNIILILDAGSTIYPIFQLLCQSRLRSEPADANRLKIITNNLPGVAAIVRYGRMGQGHTANTVFETRLLRGFINIQYEASLSAQTATDLCAAVGEYLGLEYPSTNEEWQRVASNSELVQARHMELLEKETDSDYKNFQTALEGFCDAVTGFKQHINAHKEDNTKIISVTTGNYVSIPDGPLARDKNHVQTKSTMIGLADKTYVLAPLGKLQPETGSEFNKANNSESYATKYHYMPNWQSLKDQNIVLVHTTRNPDYFANLKSAQLTGHFFRIQDRCQTANFHDRIEQEYDPSMYPGVIKRTAILYHLHLALQEYEFPHETLRKNVLKVLAR